MHLQGTAMIRKIFWIATAAIIFNNVCFAQVSSIPSMQNSTAISSSNLDTVRRLKNSGNLVRAKQEAVLYLQRNPNDVDGMLLLGIINYQQKDFVNAQKLAVQVLNKVPKYEDARLLLIRTLIATKNYPQALNQIKIGLGLNPNSAQLKAMQTSLSNITTQSAASNSNSSSSKQVEAKSGYNYQSILALRNSGRLDAAEKAARSYLQSSPQDVDVMLLLGTILYQKKNYLESKKLGLLVLTKVPTYTDARILVISNALALKQLDEAKTQLEIGLKYAPNNKQLQQIRNTIWRDNQKKSQ